MRYSQGKSKIIYSFTIIGLEDLSSVCVRMRLVGASVILCAYFYHDPVSCLPAATTQTCPLICTKDKQEAVIRFCGRRVCKVLKCIAKFHHNTSTVLYRIKAFFCVCVDREAQKWLNKCNTKIGMWTPVNLDYTRQHSIR